MDTDRAPLPARVYSRDAAELRADLAASFEAALGDWATPSQHDSAGLILATIHDRADTFRALTRVLTVFGPATFGAVCLFHQEAQTSLMNTAEALTHPHDLSRMSVSIADLRWPADALHDAFAADAATWDPADLARFRSLVDRFRTTHHTGA